MDGRRTRRTSCPQCLASQVSKCWSLGLDWREIGNELSSLLLRRTAGCFQSVGHRSSDWWFNTLSTTVDEKPFPRILSSCKPTKPAKSWWWWRQGTLKLRLWHDDGPTRKIETYQHSPVHIDQMEILEAFLGCEPDFDSLGRSLSM